MTKEKQKQKRNHNFKNKILLDITQLSVIVPSLKVIKNKSLIKAEFKLHYKVSHVLNF